MKTRNIKRGDDLSSRTLTDSCLSRIHDPAGEGARAFTKVYDEMKRATADFADRARSLGIDADPLANALLSKMLLFALRSSRAVPNSNLLVRTR